MNRKMAKEWLNAAFDDLEAIELLLDNPNLTNIVAFHSQQSIEKSIKALLELNLKRIPKIHTIKKLLTLVSDIIVFDVDDELIIKIDSLYIESRYPGEFGILPNGKPTLKDAKEFFDCAQKIYKKVVSIIVCIHAP